VEQLYIGFKKLYLKIEEEQTQVTIKDSADKIMEFFEDLLEEKQTALTKKFPLLFNKKTFELLCEGAE
jgi:DNA-directed RNA polymerase subunit L